MKNSLSRTDRVAVALLDIFSVVLILVLGAAFLYFAGPRLPRGENTDLLYTVRFSSLRAEYVADIHEGDTVLDAVGKRCIGTVVSYRVEQAYAETYDRTKNELRKAPYPGRVTLTLHIRTTASETEGGWSLSGFKLARGREIPLRLPNFVGTGVCTATQVRTADS